MILRVLGLLLAAAAVPTGGVMIARRLRLLTGGEIADGTIVRVLAASAGGAIAYHLIVETDDPRLGTREVRAYREFEPDTRVRIRVHPSDPDGAWLAEWSHLGYELMIGLLVLLAGALAAAAALVA